MSNQILHTTQLSVDDAAAVLQQLSEIQEQQANQLQLFHDEDKRVSSDNEVDLQHPIFDAFISSGGPNGILK